MQEGTRLGIEIVWITVAVVWLLSSLRRKPVARVSPRGDRLVQVGLLAGAGMLLFTSWPPVAGFDTRFVPRAEVISALGLLVAMAGAAFAILARLILGANWSGRAAIRDAHEIVCRGPYALVRHPIYTGLLGAAAGTALASGRLHHLLGVVLLWSAFELKRRDEEELLLRTFGDDYRKYRQSVRSAILPFVS
jgi:protein-S-isoprenylcysteine O-methyltransferase Ste14